MSEQKLNDDFLAALQGGKPEGMDNRWRLLARMVRNALLIKNHEDESKYKTNNLVLREKIRAQLEKEFLLPKRKPKYKAWIIGMLVGATAVYATKEIMHFTQPQNVVVNETQEHQMDKDDPRQFWKLWYDKFGTFKMFGSKHFVEPIETNITGCSLETISYESCNKLLKSHSANAALLFNMGLIYEQGLGVAVNYEKAFEFYKRSAAFGNVQALKNYEYLISEDLIQ